MGKSNQIVMEVNDFNITLLEEDINNILPYARKVLSAFKEMKIGDYPYNQITSIPAKEVITSVRRKQLKESDSNVGGIKINPEKILEMAELPIGWNKLNDATRELETYLENFHSRHYGINGSALLTFLSVTDNGVVLNDAAFDKFKTDQTMIAETPSQIEMFNRVKAFCDSLNEFAPYYNANVQSADFAHALYQFRGFKLGADGKGFVPDGDYIKRRAL